MVILSVDVCCLEVTDCFLLGTRRIQIRCFVEKKEKLDFQVRLTVVILIVADFGDMCFKVQYLLTIESGTRIQQR